MNFPLCALISSIKYRFSVQLVGYCMYFHFVPVSQLRILRTAGISIMLEYSPHQNIIHKKWQCNIVTLFCLFCWLKLFVGDKRIQPSWPDCYLWSSCVFVRMLMILWETKRQRKGARQGWRWLPSAEMWFPLPLTPASCLCYFWCNLYVFSLLFNHPALSLSPVLSFLSFCPSLFINLCSSSHNVSAVTDWIWTQSCQEPDIKEDPPETGSAFSRKKNWREFWE